MKLLVQSAMVTVVVLLVAAGVWAQRVANWGEGSAGNQKAEFSWSRLSYTTAMGGGGYGGYGGIRRRIWRGGWGATWQRDYPKADRQFLIALNRLTRIEGRSTEQVVSLDNDDIYQLSVCVCGEVQTWTFTDEEAKRMREYLLKGGFLMVDDFHGTAGLGELHDAGCGRSFPMRRSIRWKT